MLRVRSFALAFFGRIRKDQEAPFAVAGRKSFASKRIFEEVLFICARFSRSTPSDSLRVR
jgi:hypothetical protein